MTRLVLLFLAFMELAACHGASSPPGPDAGGYCVRRGLNGPCIGDAGTGSGTR